MKTDRTVVRLRILVGMVIALRSARAQPMGTEFTYQGQLKKDGRAVTETQIAGARFALQRQRPRVVTSGCHRPARFQQTQGRQEHDWT